MKVTGHRGAVNLAPENTLAGIRKAIELGCDYVEFDVHLSSDGEIVVIHDETVDRTTNGKGKVSELTLKKLKELDAGNGEKIPTLQEVIDLTKGKIKLKIELKGKNTTKKTVELVEKNNLIDDVCLHSFWHEMVMEAKKLNPKIRTGVILVGCPVNAYKIAYEAKANMLNLQYKFITEKLVKEAHENGIEVFAWNIDNKEDIQEIVDMGVDVIGSNSPDIIINYLKEI